MSTPRTRPGTPEGSHRGEKVLAFSVALLIGFMAGCGGLMGSDSTAARPVPMMTVFGVFLFGAGLLCGIVFPPRNYWPIVIGACAPAVLFIGTMGLLLTEDEGGSPLIGIGVPITAFLGAAAGAAAGGLLRRLFSRSGGGTDRQHP